ncbi:hypothetical protein BYT27DRAFT_7253368 [Phlegmacium glaucopus]|nr:hypothetical protein BYT27DRAFT_7253368 [Phlegmacium glaucopus]
MSIQIFPPEILDLFFDELASATEDPKSRTVLLACALTATSPTGIQVFGAELHVDSTCLV